MREELRQVLETARAEGRSTLLETEGLELARELQVAVPAYLVVADAEAAAAADLAAFPGERVVVKVLSPEIAHKSDVGGIAIVTRSQVADVVRGMQDRFADRDVVGYMLSEFVEHEAGLGGELLASIRCTSDFGPVVTFGAGGIYTEFLAEKLQPGVAIFSPALGDSATIDRGLLKTAVTPLLTGGLRNQAARCNLEDLRGLINRMLELAGEFAALGVSEFEINPLVPTARGFVALDALVHLGDGIPETPPARPLDKLHNLLQPRSIALIGVSEKLNPGRIMLQNILREGFPAQHVHIVKPGCEAIDGCRCYPDLESIPEPLDLFVIGVAAGMVPAVMREVVRLEKAESLILIPGGLGESEGSEGYAAEIKDSLQASRATEWRGPVINGANCLGIRSRPGHYDTLFIPQHKLSFPDGATPLAFIAQSGAFAVARSSKLWSLAPKYVATIGNQIDLTAGDYLSYLADDPEIEVFACYVEGFRPLDGRRWLEAAAEITASGRQVVLYRAGRTPEGAHASASHTASIAGDYAVTRELAEAAGVLVAETLAEFDDLVRLCVFLRDKRVEGRRLGAISNAGFECVAIADNLTGFKLGGFQPETADRLTAALERNRLTSIVGVQNPMDLTPITGDEPYEDIVRAVLADPGVDVGVVGCVPLSPVMNTLAEGEGHREDISREDSFPKRLGRVRAETDKAFVAVVDGGPDYEPMALLLEQQGIPTFSTADRALRMFSRYCDRRLGD